MRAQAWLPALSSAGSRVDVVGGSTAIVEAAAGLPMSILIAAGLWRSLHYVVLGRASLLAACKILGSQAKTYNRSRDRANSRQTKMILTNCAACAAPLAHNAPRCVRCHVRYCGGKKTFHERAFAPGWLE